MKKVIFYINRTSIYTITLLFTLLSSTHAQNKLDSLQKALNAAKSNAQKAYINYSIGDYYLDTEQNPPEGIKWFNKSLTYISKKSNDTIYYLNQLKRIICFSEIMEDALYNDSSTFLMNKIGKDFPISNNRINANYYLMLGSFETNKDPNKGLEIFFKAKEYLIKTGDKDAERAQRRIATIYRMINEHKKALQILLPLYKKYKNKDIYKQTILEEDIGMCYKGLDNDSCLSFLKESANAHLTILHDTISFIKDQSLLMDQLVRKKKYVEGEKVLESCKAIMKVYSKIITNEVYNFIFGISGDLYLNKSKLEKGDVLNTKTNILKAIDYYKQALAYTNKEFILVEQSNSISALQGISNGFAKLGNTDSAIYYLEKAQFLKDTIRQIEFNISTQEALAKYELKKKDDNIIELSERNSLIEKRNSLSRIIIIVSIVAALSLLAGLIIFIKRYKDKKQLSNELNEKQKLIEEAYNTLEAKNNTINDNIEYAVNIQKSFLDNEEKLKSIFKNSFALNLPLQKVSGDFFWVKQSSSGIYLALADCTGHGVSGAFMTLICYSMLAEALSNNPYEKPNVLLKTINNKLYTSFSKSENNAIGSKNGMDIVLLCISNDLKTINYSCASQTIFVSHFNEKISVLNSQTYSIGMFPNFEFEDYEYNTQPGDTLYLSTDGYFDQKGGPNNKKYLKSNFIKAISHLNKLTADERKTALQNEFFNWKENKTQVDDVLVIGISV